MSNMATPPTFKQLRMIGKGFCGTVWAHDDDAVAYKREHGGPDRNLENDYNIHNHLLEISAKHYGTSYPGFRIPQCH